MGIVVGAGAVLLNEKGQVLMLLRNKEPERNKWSIPGGKVDLFETVEQAIVREVEEETGLIIEIEQPLCMDELIVPEQETHVLSLIYSAHQIGGELENREPQKHAELKWFSLENLPSDSEIAAFSKKALRLTRNHSSHTLKEDFSS